MPPFQTKNAPNRANTTRYGMNGVINSGSADGALMIDRTKSPESMRAIETSQETGDTTHLDQQTKQVGRVVVYFHVWTVSA